MLWSPRLFSPIRIWLESTQVGLSNRFLSLERGILQSAGGRVCLQSCIVTVCVNSEMDLPQVCLLRFRPTSGQSLFFPHSLSRFLITPRIFASKTNIKQAWQASLNAAKSTSKWAQLIGARTDRTFNQTNPLLHAASIYRVNRNNSFHRKPNPTREKEGGREEECSPWSHTAEEAAAGRTRTAGDAQFPQTAWRSSGVSRPRPVCLPSLSALRTLHRQTAIKVTMWPTTTKVGNTFPGGLAGIRARFSVESPGLCRQGEGGGAKAKGEGGVEKRGQRLGVGCHPKLLKPEQ